MIFMFLRGIFKKKIYKKISQKPSMLREKQGQFWNLHRISNKTSYSDFHFFLFQVISGLNMSS